MRKIVKYKRKFIHIFAGIASAFVSIFLHIYPIWKCFFLSVTFFTPIRCGLLEPDNSISFLTNYSSRWKEMALSKRACPL
jgi:hypothetical protein